MDESWTGTIQLFDDNYKVGPTWRMPYWKESDDPFDERLQFDAKMFVFLILGGVVQLITQLFIIMA